jgi:tRNA threonylcarbamoyladenosine biosynthesis protein TsaB
MVLFTIDTSGKNGSLGLSRRDVGATIQVLASESLNGGQYSAELIPKLAAMLKRCGLKKAEIDAIAVVAGPGSFTGLRVGLAAAKGLAEILQKPLTALSALELVAITSAQRAGTVLAALDAGRNEIFLARCELHPQLEVRTRAEMLIKQAELGNRMREFGCALITPDDKVAALAREAEMAVEQVAPPSVELLSRLAFAQLDRGITVRPDDLDANYIRRSDAEIFSAPLL